MRKVVDGRMGYDRASKTRPAEPVPAPDHPEPPDRRTLQRGEAVFRTLRQAIRDGVYRAGDRLREEEVAQRFAVSRTPVREALGRLVAKGMVVPAGGRGLVVRSLDTAELLELYAMREILEGAAARLAAQHASAEAVAELRHLGALFEGETDVAALARLNRCFHECIVRAARIGFLDTSLGELQDGLVLLGPTTFGVDGRPGVAASEHRAIVAAIADAAPDEAERAARAHIREALGARMRLPPTA